MLSRYRNPDLDDPTYDCANVNGCNASWRWVCHLLSVQMYQIEDGLSPSCSSASSWGLVSHSCSSLSGWGLVWLIPVLVCQAEDGLFPVHMWSQRMDVFESTGIWNDESSLCCRSRFCNCVLLITVDCLLPHACRGTLDLVMTDVTGLNFIGAWIVAPVGS